MPALRALLFVSLIALTIQGLPNVLLAGTPFVGWKQVMLMLCLGLAIIHVRRTANAVISAWTVFAALVLCIWGLGSDVDFGTSLLNSYYYVGWLPFYLLGTGTPNGVIGKGAGRLVFGLILLSAVGLMLQLYTGVLDFLKSAAEASYRSAFQETQRFAFVFVTSTGVMPTLFGLTRMYLGHGARAAGKAWVAVALMVSAVPTGSLAALIALGGSLLALIGSAKVHGRVILVGLVVACVVGALWIGGDLMQRQIERMVGNSAGSVSNQGRLALWLAAMELIQGFSFEQHLFGKGLGTTNSNYFGQLALIHGESSFLQAYIEGGLLGLSLRLLPFAIYLRAILRFRSGVADIAYLSTMLIVCSVAPIFGIFGVECLLGFNAGLAVARGRAKCSAT
ncbi:MAG: hypothetical protein JWQ89_1021 [Devosia sp.]|nr:hypothetical protein [Devosia sp.]